MDLANLLKKAREGVCMLKANNIHAVELFCDIQKDDITMDFVPKKRKDISMSFQLGVNPKDEHAERDIRVATKEIFSLLDSSGLVVSPSKNHYSPSDRIIQ